MSSDKIAYLHQLGFADPVKMITSFPEIAGLASDNVRRKIADLRELGFADPIKMITYFPPILGLRIDNIRGRRRVERQAHGHRRPPLGQVDRVAGCHDHVRR